MLNRIINEDDYIRTSKEALEILLKRNGLWNTHMDLADNLMNVENSGKDVRRMFDDFDYGEYVRYELVELVGEPIYNNKLNFYTRYHRKIDEIKIRVTGKM